MRDSEKDDNEDGERQVERTRTRDDDMSTVAEAAATNPELAIQQLLTT